MSQEVELKLSLNEEIVSQFWALDWFHSHPSIKKQPQKLLENIYFDTPDLALLKTRAALRIRKSGEQYLQTLKTKGVSIGGLHQRGEWEHIIGDTASLAGGSPQLKTELFPEDVWPEGLDTASLIPVFETNFIRDVWLWRSAFGSVVEMVLDQGKVVSGEQESVICEMELELVEGHAGCLFDLAEALTKTLPTLVSDTTKAQRGFELFSPGVWQVDHLSLSEVTASEECLNAVLQALMTGVQESDVAVFVAVLSQLVKDKVLPDLDVNPWLLQGNPNTLSDLSRAQWLLRLARHAWLNAQSN